ncbi:MAG: hypothetical protein IJ085_06660 [Turicibacter sp.]|nr:hypothetical protein [Turicibacter sp.]
MQFDFLRQFQIRMKKVGAYAVLFKNSLAKTTWKNYGFDESYEQVNLMFSVLLYIMECSLKEEICTIDDIANFIDQLNMQSYQKILSYEQAKELALFIVDVALCNEGRPMYFEGYNYENNQYESIYISFVGNKIVYVDQELKRTSYFLTDEGYELMLSTLEVDSHLQLTIQEMIFKLLLEKATYDKAVDDVKTIFNLLRIQFQKIEGAMRKIRQNALLYSVDDYKEIVEQNLAIIEETKEKFLGYRETIKRRMDELEEKDITIQKLADDEKENLGHLKTIEGYLNQVLDEHQRILNSHFDLKSLYTKELEGLTQMSLIKRFNIRTELYEEVLKQPLTLDFMDYFLRPLFTKPFEKTYNLNKCIELQRPISKKKKEAEFFTTIEEESVEDFIQEQKRQRLNRYLESLRLLLSFVFQSGVIELSEIKAQLDEENLQQLIPSVEIFKEIMIELLQAKSLDIAKLKQERLENISEQNYEFQLSTCLLDVLEQHFPLKKIETLSITRTQSEEVVKFEQVMDEAGRKKTIQCSNIRLEVS